MEETRDWKAKALALCAHVNAGGLGARMPHAEMIVAANSLTDEGLMERREDGRWLTERGRQSLPTPPNTTT